MDDKLIFQDQDYSLRIPDPPRTITMHSADGRTAVIDFGGEAVTFSGTLPVDDAAKVFFEAVGDLLRRAPT